MLPPHERAADVRRRYREHLQASHHRLVGVVVRGHPEKAHVGEGEGGDLARQLVAPQHPLARRRHARGIVERVGEARLAAGVTVDESHIELEGTNGLSSTEGRLELEDRAHVGPGPRIDARPGHHPGPLGEPVDRGRVVLILESEGQDENPGRELEALPEPSGPLFGPRKGVDLQRGRLDEENAVGGREDVLGAGRGPGDREVLERDPGVDGVAPDRRPDVEGGRARAKEG